MEVLEVVLVGHFVDHSAGRSVDQQRTGGRWAWTLPCSVVGDSRLVLRQSWQEVGLASRQRHRS